MPETQDYGVPIQVPQHDWEYVFSAGPAVQAFILVPAVAGKVAMLDSCLFTLVNTAAVAFLSGVQVNDNSSVGTTLAQTAASIPAVSGSIDRFLVSHVTGLLGRALWVGFGTAPPANVIEQLTMGGWYV